MTQGVQKRLFFIDGRHAYSGRTYIDCMDAGTRRRGRHSQKTVKKLVEPIRSHPFNHFGFALVHSCISAAAPYPCHRSRRPQLPCAAGFPVSLSHETAPRFDDSPAPRSALLNHPRERYRLNFEKQRRAFRGPRVDLRHPELVS